MLVQLHICCNQLSPIIIGSMMYATDGCCDDCVSSVRYLLHHLCCCTVYCQYSLAEQFHHSIGGHLANAAIVELQNTGCTRMCIPCTIADIKDKVILLQPSCCDMDYTVTSIMLQPSCCGINYAVAFMYDIDYAAACLLSTVNERENIS